MQILLEHVHIAAAFTLVVFCHTTNAAWAWECRGYMHAFEQDWTMGGMWCVKAVITKQHTSGGEPAAGLLPGGF